MAPAAAFVLTGCGPREPADQAYRERREEDYRATREAVLDPRMRDEEERTATETVGERGRREEDYRTAIMTVRRMLPRAQSVSPSGETKVFRDGLGRIVATGWVDQQDERGSLTRKRFKVTGHFVRFED
ncbi:MAG TPA: hypothetical protein VGO90_17890 [Chthoniobacteraceae bacterium]|jgi:hypothetical protein|nr:hypothetical protein [Chthoniobacteraceae bacterium]